MTTSPTLKGRINHSASGWCYSKEGLDELCKAAVEIGIKSIDLANPPDFPTLKKYGLTCAMVSFPTAKGPNGETIGVIERSFNRREYHAPLQKAYESHINTVADAGFQNIVCFPGNRAGMSDEEGLKNCVEGIEPLLPLCEKRDVTLCMELLNSRVDHSDYMCDHTEWGVALAKKIGSKYFSLLYDIYHMQIMEGDIIATIRKHHEYIAHYHTAGVPGRHEIDETQEIYYPAIMRAIVETGYQGFVAQEFVPTNPDWKKSLRDSIHICDV